MYEVQVVSNRIKFIPKFVKMNQLVQKLKEGSQTDSTVTS
jgi:hypothetical protein